jgi:hypothetical protein
MAEERDLIDGGIAISHAGREAFLAVSPPVCGRLRPRSRAPKT